MSSFPDWKAPQKPIISQLSEIDTKVLSDLREYYEVVDPLRVLNDNVIGSEFYDRQLDSVTAQQTIANDATDTSIYSYALAGGTLQTQGAIRCDIRGDYKNSSGANKTLTLTILYATNILWQDTTPNLPSQPSYCAFHIWFDVYATNNPNIPSIAGEIFMGDRFALPTVGIGSFNAPGAVYPIATDPGVVTADSKSTQTLEVKFKHSAASASTVYHRNSVTLKRIAH